MQVPQYEADGPRLVVGRSSWCTPLCIPPLSTTTSLHPHDTLHTDLNGTCNALANAISFQTVRRSRILQILNPVKLLRRRRCLTTSLAPEDCQRPLRANHRVFITFTTRFDSAKLFYELQFPMESLCYHPEPQVMTTISLHGKMPGRFFGRVGTSCIHNRPQCWRWCQRRNDINDLLMRPFMIENLLLIFL